VILVPSPNVSEDHQTKNAMALVDKNAAILVKDFESREQLVDTTLRLLADDTLQASLSKNIHEMAIVNAAERIVDELLALK
jgi:UDP-N-acetylglucosamine--N-acetylmuramyl-(pentapeptide) pyrophosphoryl-undecaprenol N-acetylglucosamine transferase